MRVSGPLSFSSGYNIPCFIILLDTLYGKRIISMHIAISGNVNKRRFRRPKVSTVWWARPGVQIRNWCANALFCPFLCRSPSPKNAVISTVIILRGLKVERTEVPIRVLACRFLKAIT